jgi:hypothetical protein
MISGADVENVIAEFRYAAGSAERHAGHGCATSAFAAGYAAALAGILQSLGVSEEDAFGTDSAPDPADITVRVEPSGPPLTVADIDQTNVDALLAALVGDQSGTGEGDVK